MHFDLNNGHFNSRQNIPVITGLSGTWRLVSVSLLRATESRHVSQRK